MLPKTPSQKYKYAHPWAQEIVEAFLEKQSRGTDNLCKIAGISHKQLCESLIHAVRLDNQLRWRSMKLMVKQARNDDFRDFKGVPVEERRKYLTIVKYNAEDVVLEEIKAENVLDYQPELS